MAKKPGKTSAAKKTPKAPKAAAKEPMSLTKFLNAKYKGKFKAATGQSVRESNTIKHWVPTGILPLDIAISPGALGLPAGRVITLSAWSSHGKTMLALLIAAAFQRAGGVVHYIEPEDTLDADFAEGMGVRMEEDIFFQPPPSFDSSIEDCFDYIHKTAEFHMTHQPKVPVIYVIDSISDLLCKKMIEEGYKDVTKYGPLEARIHRNGTKKLKAFIAKSKITVLAISHLIMNISMDAKTPVVGDKEITTGGRAWEFRSALHLRMKPAVGAARIQYTKDAKVGDRVYEQAGSQFEVCAKKSKLGPPYHKAFLTFYFEDSDEHKMGVDGSEALLIWLKDRELVWKFKAPEKKPTKEEKALAAAGAQELQLDSGVYQFVGLTGFRKLLADPKFKEELHQFMLERKSTWGAHDDPDREKAEDENAKREHVKRLQKSEDEREADRSTDLDVESLGDETPEFEDTIEDEEEEDDGDETSDVEPAEGEVAADEE